MYNMNSADDNTTALKMLCQHQPLAVLATGSGPAPYASLIAIAASPDLHSFYFSTPRVTHKYANLTCNNMVSLLIDNRSNQVVDFSTATAATILGRADELTGSEREPGLDLYLSRHPHLSEFAASQDFAFFRVQVDRILLVKGFRDVTEFNFQS